MNNVRTVSDTKRAFYSQHTRPINAIYRRVVEELMVEAHLLLVNADFNYDSIYALGVVSTYDRFMQGYEPAGDRDNIYRAILQANEADPDQYRRDAEELIGVAKSLPSIDSFKSVLDQAKTASGSDTLQANLHKAISNPKFKYSRLFAIGLYNVIEAIDAELLNDKDKRDALMTEVATTIELNEDLLKKDIDLYRGNLEKMAQAQEVMKDMIEADKKKKAKREEEKKKRAEAKAAAEKAKATETTETTETTEAPSTNEAE
ncbi:photosystem II biogenesis protein Psp29 [cf. Phormidesmis sp. LEGE 11477]|uniref:photosystem II biogenesis protein Psp29 n=1 Tax=cf. Phormidesmis sp. LEGE 11477 TaxID=1828680 RepID=UPI001881E7A6|nr:photosystem II biogenesis protein Psp29 [cf. Phormidesmis sp. LEGE 11477]